MGSDRLNANQVTKVAGQSLQCRFPQDLGAAHQNSFQRFVLPTEATRFSSPCDRYHAKHALAARSIFSPTPRTAPRDYVDFVAASGESQCRLGRKNQRIQTSRRSVASGVIFWIRPFAARQWTAFPSSRIWFPANEHWTSVA